MIMLNPGSIKNIGSRDGKCTYVCDKTRKILFLYPFCVDTIKKMKINLKKLANSKLFY